MTDLIPSGGSATQQSSYVLDTCSGIAPLLRLSFAINRSHLRPVVLLAAPVLTAQQAPVSGTAVYINSQPVATRIGVGYMRNGTVDIVQSLTNDHDKAASSLRLPFGEPGMNGSPYFLVSDLIKQGVKLRTEVSNAQLVAADSVYVPPRNEWELQ